MLINPKTGTTWAPDIRPEEIEEFDEEASDGAIAQYKAVDNHPILNKVLDKMAFFRTHVGAVWYNKFDNISLKQKLDAMDAQIPQKYSFQGTKAVSSGGISSAYVSAGNLGLPAGLRIIIADVHQKYDSAQNIVPGIDIAYDIDDGNERAVNVLFYNTTNATKSIDYTVDVLAIKKSSG